MIFKIIKKQNWEKYLRALTIHFLDCVELAFWWQYAEMLILLPYFSFRRQKNPIF